VFARGIAGFVACALLLAGCGGDESPATQQTMAASSTAESTPSAPASSPTPTESAQGTSIKLAKSQFGPVLFDATGQAIYLFDKEKSSTPQCYGECAEAWPPVVTESAPAAVTGVRAELLGTTARTDGSTQVTYAGHPLYFYAHEGKNVVLCHNVREYGGLWLAVTGSGEAAPH
jgi:predicted lipoprotein with Yx(FWY)xxD motif